MKSLKLRPVDCCAPPTSVEPLPEAQRAPLVAMFHALGDPTRLEIFRLIAGQAAPICVCDITARFAVTQPTISHHLRILREAGLIRVLRQGIWAYYSVNPAGLAGITDIGSALQVARSNGRD